MNQIYRYEPETWERTVRLSFEQLDEIPYSDQNGEVLDHKNLERWEQLIAREHILPTDAVLELGGRFGTVSCVINHILDRPENHVVIEPEEAVIPALLQNREKHHGFFTVYQNIISHQPKQLIYGGHATRAIGCSCKEDSIPCMSLQDVLNHHAFPFTVLVADCEGCMEEFVANHLDFIRTLRLVTYEQDFPELSDYTRVSDMLTQCGFTCIVQGFHTVWVRR